MSETSHRSATEVTGTKSSLSADRPLRNPDEDLLGYRAFSKAIATSIANMRPTEDAFVMAVTGEWGSGKSTALNFVIHELEQTSSQMDVVEFNPWWFSGEEDMLLAFFAELVAALPQEDFGGVRRRFVKLAKGVSRAARIAAPVAGGAAEVVAGAADWATDALARNTTIVQQKRELAKSLGEKQKRILVVIDDIDRLTPAEAAKLFRVVRSVADFPSITYLLAFDRVQVARLLEKALGINGADYIDKIVQVEFPLPQPDAQSLIGCFLDRIGQTITADPERERTLSMLLNDGPPRTMRHVIRAVNMFRVRHAAAPQDVDVVDMALRCLQQVRSPEV